MVAEIFSTLSTLSVLSSSRQHNSLQSAQAQQKPGEECPLGAWQPLLPAGLLAGNIKAWLSPGMEEVAGRPKANWCFSRIFHCSTPFLACQPIFASLKRVFWNPYTMPLWVSWDINFSTWSHSLVVEDLLRCPQDRAEDPKSASTVPMPRQGGNSSIPCTSLFWNFVGLIKLLENVKFWE